MTVIAWDGTTLATDRQTTFGALKRRCRKCERLQDGTLLATTGGTSDGAMMRKWYKDGADPEKFPSCQRDEDWAMLVVVPPRGSILQYDTNPLPLKLGRKAWAWGCGGPYALGAMACGATAKEAVRIASRFDAYCGLGVDAYDSRPHT